MYLISFSSEIDFYLHYHYFIPSLNMRRFYSYLLFLPLMTLSCNTGNLKVVANIPIDLTEVSAVETTSSSDLIWVIEDSGNKNHLYGLDSSGFIVKSILIGNSKNMDWEDLTSDSEGNLYIGDFGNNSKKRETFTIYKVNNVASVEGEVNAEIITFKLPDTIKPRDFEAFFLFDDYFYVFSKDNKKAIVVSVPNLTGNHLAKFVTEFNLIGKKNSITSADISPDNKTIVLLNHSKLWRLTDFDGDNFFEGSVNTLSFDHTSQKEGICFKSNNTVVITDEYDDMEGGNVYEFSFDK